MAGTLRVAVAGAGYFSRFHCDSWQRMTRAGDVEFVAICDRHCGRAEALARGYGIASVFDDYDAMMSSIDMDLVDIVTPPDTHEQLVLSAVDRDTAVICQKPFTPTLREAERLVEQIDRRDGRVFVHENFRFQPWYPRIKSALERGLIGEPYQITFSIRPGDGQGPNAYLERQPYFQTMPRFLIHETAIHLIDTFRYLFGEISSVFAQLDRLNPAIAGEDAALIIFNFANGRRGVLDGNRLADHAADDCRLTLGEMRIEGSDGTLSLVGDGSLWWRRFGERHQEQLVFDWQDVHLSGDSVYSTNRHIVDHLLRGEPAMNSAAEYLANIRIEEAVYQSARSERTVHLDASIPEVPSDVQVTKPHAR